MSRFTAMAAAVSAVLFSMLPAANAMSSHIPSNRAAFIPLPVTARSSKILGQGEVARVQKMPTVEGVYVCDGRFHSRIAMNAMKPSATNVDAINRRHFLSKTVLFVLFATPFGLHPCHADEDEDDQGLGEVLTSPCGKTCMPKCFENFGAALQPGTRADVEVYCRSRCVFTCAAAPNNDSTSSVNSDPLLRPRSNSEKQYCKFGKEATKVQSGVYAEQGLEFYGCD